MGAVGHCLGVLTGGEIGQAVIPGKVPEPRPRATSTKS
jgi:hypothetical protein